MALRKVTKPATAEAVDRLQNDRLGGAINQKNNPPTTAKQARGGRRSRDKGNRAERAIVQFLQDQGFAAERVPLSGSAGGSYVGDITLPVLGVDRVVEVKCRARGFRELYAWLTGRDILIVRADRLPPLVVVPLKLAAEIAAGAEKVRR